MKDVGRYRIIRSSKDERAMIGWSSKRFDNNSKRWFETSGGGFCDWDDISALLDADDLEMCRHREELPQLLVRESFWEITYGAEEMIAEEALFVLDEYEEGEHRVFTFTVGDVSLEELDKWKEAVWRWYTWGELKFGNFKCSVI